MSHGEASTRGNILQQQHSNPELPASLGHVETRSYQFAFPPNELTLESGEKLGPITWPMRRMAN